MGLRSLLSKLRAKAINAVKTAHDLQVHSATTPAGEKVIQLQVTTAETGVIQTPFFSPVKLLTVLKGFLPKK